MTLYFIMMECISSILNLSLQGQQLLPIPQASKIKVVSYMLRSKDHVLHQIKKIIYEVVFTREKRMFCSQKASGPSCLISRLLVVF